MRGRTGSERRDERLLRLVEVAEELGARSIAFPAISTGIYGYPPEEAATVAVDTIRTTPITVDVVRLVAFDERTLHLYEQRLARGSG